jgi:hypothetical protein
VVFAQVVRLILVEVLVVDMLPQPMAALAS